MAPNIKINANYFVVLDINTRGLNGTQSPEQVLISRPSYKQKRLQIGKRDVSKSVENSHCSYLDCDILPASIYSLKMEQYIPPKHQHYMVSLPSRR
jgi:hypothetical protein